MRVISLVLSGLFIAGAARAEEPQPLLHSQEIAVTMPPELNNKRFDLGALCLSGAGQPILPSSWVLTQVAKEIRKEVFARAGGITSSPEAQQNRLLSLVGETGTQTALGRDPSLSAYSAPLDLPWGQVLAERAQKMPPGLSDVPLLLILADVEGELSGGVSSLGFGAVSVITPDLVAVLRRHGLDSRAEVLELMMADLPDWSRGAVARSQEMAARFENGQGSYDGPLFRALSAYPRDGAVRLAVLKLLLSQEGTRAALEQRRLDIDDSQRLEWLLRRLRVDCQWGQWLDPVATDQLLTGLSPAVRALLLLDQFLSVSQETVLSAYLGDHTGSSGPALYELFIQRGLIAEAEALAQAIALFPQPFPRQDEERMLRFEADAALSKALASVQMPANYRTRLQDEMLKIAIEAQLLPL